MNPTFLQFISANHLAVAAGCAAGVGMCFFFCGVQLFAHRYSSDRAPSVTVSAAAPGLATISGKAAGLRTLAAPLSGKPCFVYRTCIWQLHESDGKKEWKNLAEETGHLTFLIEDETGRILVEPSGAQLDLRQDRSEEYGSPNSYSPEPSAESSDKKTVPHALANFLARNGVSLDRPTRAEEYCLEPETPVVVTGTVARNSAMQADSLATTSAVSSDNQPLVLARPAGERPEIIRLTSGATPQSTTQMSQQAKIAAALAKAGLSQRDAWATPDAAVPGIASGVNSHQKSERSQSTSMPYSTIPALALATTMTVATTAMTMMVMRGADDATFIISNLNQPSNPTSLGWKSVALVLAGSTLTTLSLYILLAAHLR